MNKQRLIILEGPVAVGKSTLLSNMPDVWQIKENYLEFCQNYGFNTNTYESQLGWIVHWFTRVEFCHRMDPSIPIVTDRSPYSSLCYTQNVVDQLLPLITKKFNYFQTIFDIQYYLLQCNEDERIKRITDRANKNSIRDLDFELNIMRHENKWYADSFLSLYNPCGTMREIVMVNTNDTVENLIRIIK